jgi:hypothetical protein
MLTRRQALQLVIAAPALRVTPIAPASAPYVFSVPTARTITLGRAPTPAEIQKLHDWYAKWAVTINGQVFKPATSIAGDL